MKSEICPLNKELISLNMILKEVESFNKKCEINKKDSLRIRLLAEELRGMLPGLIENFEGVFWIENNGDVIELHVELETEGMSLDSRDKLIAVSKSGKNAAAKGIMGKIRAVAETMILSITEPSISIYDPYYNMGLIYIDPTSAVDTSYLYSWSLNNYKHNVYF